jgi:hypothetical protein
VSVYSKAGLSERRKIMQMKISVFLLTLFLMTTGALAATDPSGAPSKPQAAETETSTVPDQHFQKAHENFMKRDTKGAASEIRKGAEFLKKEAENGAGETKKALTDSAKELERLAGDVEKGTVTSVKMLDDGFAKADHALARHHLAKATNAWSKKENSKTGEDLKAAGVYLEHGLSWTGRKTETSTEDVLHHSRVLAGNLIKGSGWVPEEVGKGLQSVGNEIDKLGQRVG